MSEALVANAADEKQVKEAEGKVKFKRDQELSDIKFILQTNQGRRFMWRLLAQCKVNNTIFNTNALLQSYNSGQQDIGHFVLGEIVKADEDSYLKMMKESKENKL